MKVPLQLNEFAVSLEGSLQEFHSSAIALADRSTPTDKNTGMPEVMLRTYCKTLGLELKWVEASIKSKQKELNRIFAKTIETELHQAYQECAEQSGEFSVFVLYAGGKRGRRIMRLDFVPSPNRRYISYSFLTHLK